MLFGESISAVDNTMACLLLMQKSNSPWKLTGGTGWEKQSSNFLRTNKSVRPHSAHIYPLVCCAGNKNVPSRKL